MIARVIDEQPVEFLKVCARLLPRDVHFTQGGTTHMSEQAVNELIEEIEKEIARRKRGAALTIEASPKDDETT